VCLELDGDGAGAGSVPWAGLAGLACLGGVARSLAGGGLNGVDGCVEAQGLCVCCCLTSHLCIPWCKPLAFPSLSPRFWQKLGKAWLLEPLFNDQFVEIMLDSLQC